VKVQESFVIAEPRERLWEFFEQVDQVARCVPGVESVEVIDDENSKVRVTQSIGPMTATFDLKMKITERSPHELMQFTAIGRAVKGAAGNIRTTNTVRLSETEDGTRVELESELAMGGVLGSVGQKVVAKQAGQVTKQFSDALQRAITGEPEPEPEPTATSAPSPNGTAPVAQPSSTAMTANDDQRRVAVLVASMLAAVAAWRVFARIRRR
jgi:carbon monoxide dehydrogenase subunit G